MTTKRGKFSVLLNISLWETESEVGKTVRCFEAALGYLGFFTLPNFQDFVLVKLVYYFPPLFKYGRKSYIQRVLFHVDLSSENARRL